MRVRLKSLIAGPDGVFAPGTELDRADGEALVAGGYAEPLEAPAPAASEQAPQPVERAVEPAAEQAVAQPQRGRRSRG